MISKIKKKAVGEFHTEECFKIFLESESTYLLSMLGTLGLIPSTNTDNNSKLIQTKTRQIILAHLFELGVG